MKKAIKIVLIIAAALIVLVVGGYFLLVSLFTGAPQLDYTEPAEHSTTKAGVLVYTKAYQLQGDPGDGLADDTAAQYLFDVICKNFPGEDVHLTLIGLGDTPTGEAYLFAGPIDTTYAVVYGNSDLYFESGKDGEWVAMDGKNPIKQEETVSSYAELNDEVKRLGQLLSDNGIPSDSVRYTIDISLSEELSKPENMTTANMSEVVYRHAEQWKAEMKKVLASLNQKMSAEQKTLLADSQTKWEAFMKVNDDLEHKVMEQTGGSITSNVAANAYYEKYRNRALYLKMLLENAE